MPMQQSLPIFKQLPYISPSTFQKWKNCQHSVYLSKLAGLPWIAETSSLAAQIGVAFDLFVKDYLMKKRKEHCPHILLDITIKNLMPEAVKLGRELAVKYTQSRLCHSLLEATALRLEQELYANISGIPILGRIDAIVNDIPLDWKTRGFASKNPQYPTKGYSQKLIWEERDGRAYWRDQICPVETPIEKVNEGWAAQFLFYNWLLDNEPRIYVVHEVVNTNDGVVLIEHTNTISEEFEAKVMKEMRAMWEAITEKMYYAEVERPIPTKMMCEKYASLCEQAVYCKYYLETLGHTERREMLV